ncbi:MAG TPA: TetR/AcrR family transcriptional regulator [Ktedonobacteraceae bacterium]|jgi:AcrR family transcriptional regulator|nr:TetR/AcrR family transcriptional regulator [Ktedonobacteraceae bacterium]
MARTTKVVEDRREQIIDAAMHVFAEKGFVRATNKDIAREAGITPGLIYHYFESKEALLRAIIDGRSPLRIINALPPQALALPPEVFLRFIVMQVLGILEDENFIQLIRVFLPEVVYNPDTGSTINEAIQQALGFLEGYFRNKIEAGELRPMDAALLPQLFIGSVMAFVLRRNILHDPQVLHYTHEQIADAIVETMLKGLLPGR